MVDVIFEVVVVEKAQKTKDFPKSANLLILIFELVT